MGFPRQPDDDVEQEQDPLSRYSAPTIRRSSADRGSTQPLDDLGGLPRGSGMQVDGADFANRSQQRRQRQGAAQYTQRFGELTQRVDNRTFMVALGAILLILALLLIWRVMSRNSDSNVIDGTQATAQVSDQATPGFNEPTNAFSTAQPGVDPGTGIGTEAIPVPTVATNPPSGAGAFVVAGTGTEGLFLRSEANASANVLATLPEGTEVTATGEESNDGTRTWKRVQTPQGEGWIAADFVVPRP